MAKKNREEQIDLFPEEPIIGGLSIVKFETSGAEVKANLVGVTNVNDVARIDNKCWQKAVADWLITLHLGDIDAALVDVKRAYIDFVNMHGEPHRETPDSNVFPLRD